MKKMIRLLSLLCACTLLSGCGGEQRADEPDKITWYMRTEDVKLFNNLKGFEELERAAHVEVEFLSPPDNSEDAYKMMVASGMLPDVIMWQYPYGVDQLYRDGVAIDLTELIAQHAPTLTALYEQRPELRREAESAEGRLYYFPSINPMQTREEIGRKSYQGFIMRSDWLEKLGLAAPRTISEWYEVLTAFKKRDPNGNGLPDEIPFDGWGLTYFTPAFGVLNGVCVKPDGSVVYGPMEQEYKRYLETMNKWYAEGLLGRNCIINSDKWKDENIINNLTGSFLGLDNAWRYYLPTLREKESLARMQALPWLLDDHGVRYTPREAMAGHISPVMTIITPQCKNPEAAVRLIDTMYSQWGGDLLHWGIQGVTYDVDADGRKYLLPFAMEKAEDGFMQLYHYAIGHTSFPKYDGETVVLASYPEDQLAAELTWADASTALIYPPAIHMSAEDEHTCREILSSVASYFAEMEVKFITGEEPLSNFDSFVSNLRRMGIDKALNIYRRYYQAYAELKEE